MKRMYLLAASLAFGAPIVVASAQSFGSSTAPPVSEVIVTAVQSSLGGVETTSGATSTRVHHGGSFVRVTTLEKGIGQAVATMNGAQLQELRVTNVCTQAAGYWAACRNGQTVQGRLRVWDATGKGNGSFVIRVTSVNWPRNTVTKTHSIQ